MFVDEIFLSNFRNYEKGHAQLSRGVNIIYGENARGKTNLLESVFMLSAARSHRLSRESEMIRFGCESGKISASFFSRQRQNSGEITLFSKKKKQIKINKVPIEKTSELMGIFNTVMFCPEDLRLVKGAPKERRRMLDLGLCQLSRRYFYVLSQYVKALDQRNKLLKNAPDSKTLWVWDEKLAQYGAEVIWLRREYLLKLADAAVTVHADICGEALTLEYVCGGAVTEFLSCEAVREQLIADMQRLSEREKRAGMSLTGPHRDDFEIYIDGCEAKLFGSQGQQRTVALSLKMAEVAIVNEHTGEMPVLLLDDVMSELDGNRQEYILKRIKDIQVIITCTQPFEYENANVIYVEDVKR